MSRNRDASELTAEGFDRLLAGLDPDRVRAAHAYELLRRRVLTFFRLNGFPEAAGDLFDKTMDIAARRLSEIQVDNLSGFITGIAQNLCFEAKRERKRNISLSSFAEPPDQPSPDFSEIEEKERALECLNECVKRLDPSDRSLVLEYYKYSKTEKIESHKKMAAAAGMTMGNLRVRACRIRKQLEECVKRCGSAHE